MELLANTFIMHRHYSLSPSPCSFRCLMIRELIFFCNCVFSNILEEATNLKLCPSYRLITVSGALSNVLERILLSEMVFKCNVGKCQFGFRIRMSCVFVHWLVNKIIVKAHARNLPLFHVVSISPPHLIRLCFLSSF